MDSNDGSPTASTPAAGANPDTAPAFPMRVAAVDIGTNALRYAVGEFSTPDRWRALEGERFPIRLGRGTFRTGALEPQAMDAAVVALAAIRARLHDLGVERYRAVATSAVRESANGDAFVARVRSEAGIEIDVVTGTEEARLVHLAVRHRMDLGDTRWLLVDLGGGSVEVSLVDREGLLWTESHTLGAVRLLEELEGAGEDRLQRLLAEYASTLRIPDAAAGDPPAGLIATGGNIEALAHLAGSAPGESGISVLPLEELRAAIALLSRHTLRDRVERLGLRADRADVILPAAHVYERIAEFVGVRDILVPHVGVREGVLLDLVDELVMQHEHEAHQDRLTLQAALALGRRYAFDEPHGRHVAGLALSLFDQLQGVHGLGGRDRRILAAAAVLHDIGQFISYAKHHKHSLYLISHSDLPGLTPREIAMVANVARYHRKAEPSTDHAEFARLADEERDRVVRLSSLLRLADALDREHLQRVHSIRAAVEDGQLQLEPDGTADLELEIWTLHKKARLWEQVFGMPVRLVEGTSP